MNENKVMTLWDVENSLMEDLESQKDDILAAEHAEDLLAEIIDSCIPIYNHSLLEMAMSDLWLAVDKPNFESGYGEAGSAVSVIVANLYDHLDEKAHEWLEKLLMEKEGLKIKS